MATDCDPTARPLTFDQMKAKARRTKARSRVMEAWPLACPERARQFERALLGDPAAAEVLVAGALRVLATRARQAEAGEDVGDFWRHLPGQHNQKSHGRGTISSLAVDGRVAEIVAEHGGREAARAERGSLADAALFDLAGYSGPPTVLSPGEFDAYEGQAVGPSGRSEFGRGFRTGVDAEGGQAARDMVYDEANHYAGLGIYANGTHVSSPLIASWYAGGLDTPPRHSVDDGDSGYVRVKLKPGTTVVRWEDLQTLDVPEGSGDAFAQKPGVAIVKGDSDLGISDQAVPTPPASTPATTTQRPSVEINMEAINKHGAQVIDVSGVDPTGSLIILDRSAMVVEQFVDPADAYSPEAAPTAQGMRADLPVMSVADQSRALALLVNADPTLRPRVIRDGWAGLSEAEADRAVTMFDAAFGVQSTRAERHLPGKHDQKSHGKGGGSAQIGEMEVFGQMKAIADRHGGDWDEAEREVNSIKDAAVFELAGYAGKPTVLSPAEFDAFEGQEVVYHGQPRSEFARGFYNPSSSYGFGPFKVKTGLNGEDSARDFMHDDDYWVGTGLYVNATYIGSPDVAAAFSPGVPMDSRHHSYADGSTAYVRVKIKPGTKVVDWEDLDRMEYDGTSMPQQRESWKINLDAVNQGAQIINPTNGKYDPHAGLIVLDRSALVVEQFVEKDAATSTPGPDVPIDEAAADASNVRADVPGDDWPVTPNQSRALALLVNVDPALRPQVIESGWQGLTDDQAAVAEDLFRARYGVDLRGVATEDGSTRHLPGKHDQKSHGKGGGTMGEGSLPDGWSEVTTGDMFVSVGDGESEISMSIVDNGAVLALPQGEREGYMRRAVFQTAREVARLQAAEHVPVFVEIVSPQHSMLGGGADGATNLGSIRRGKALIRLNAALYATLDIDSDGFKGYKTKDMGEAGPRPFAQAVYGRTAGKFNVGVSDNDPLRYVIAHEYGHAVASQRAWNDDGSKSIIMHKDLLSGEPTATTTEALKAMRGLSRSEFDSMTRYAKTDPDETYAEAYAAWSMRDLESPPAWAASMAERQGWA